LCGFNDLKDKDQRINRANQILNSAELKQSICLKILGASFKDVEKAMEAILKDRQPSYDAIEQTEEELYPEKFDPEVTFIANKKASNIKSTNKYYNPTAQEVAELIANGLKTVMPSTQKRIRYEPLDQETANRLVKEHKEYKKNKEKKKQEFSKLEEEKNAILRERKNKVKK
jgi:hypothetical protein